jgi:hypothetical protein
MIKATYEIIRNENEFQASKEPSGTEDWFTDKDLLLFLQYFYVPALFQSRTVEQKMPDRSIETKTRGYVDDLIGGKGEEHKMVLSQKIMLYSKRKKRKSKAK